MAAYETQFVIGRAFAVPLQEMLDLGRLAVFVSAKDANIEIETRILEIVRVTAVKSHLFLRSENDPHVVAALITIQIVDATLVERDHVRTQSRFFFALLLD